MADVVEQGAAPPGGSGWRSSPRLRRGLLVLAVVAAAALVSRTGLLSATDPTPSPTASSGVVAAHVPGVVLVEGGRLVRYDGAGTSLRHVGSRLPPGRVADPGWVAVDDLGDRMSLLAVIGNRVARLRGVGVRVLGPAARVVDASRRTGEVILQLSKADGGAVVAMDAPTGQVVEQMPFPGDVPGSGWSPEGVMSSLYADVLLLRRGNGSGADELAIAPAAREVRAGADPLQRVPSSGSLLSVWRDRVLIRTTACRTPGQCALATLTFGFEGVRVHPLRPPPGWSFTGEVPPGRSRAPLAVVTRTGSGDRALARIVAGGDTALVLHGSEGVLSSAGLVEQASGAVAFLRAEPRGKAVVMFWDGARSPVAHRVRDLPREARQGRLVCVCD